MYSIKKLLQDGKNIQGEITLKGWVRTFRSNRFIALNDGSTIDNLQVVVDFENTDPELLKRITTGAAIEVKGRLVESQGKGQNVELQASNISILGDSNPEEYPIQPKKHSLEFLRENAHLRVRSSTFSAVMRVRSTLAFAIHKYFQDNGFFYVNTPIITGSDAEGAGEMFPMALGKIYTFGPTFRAENSNTSRHLAEFWMIEPEMAFYDLIDNMNLAEDFIKYVLQYTLEVRRDDLEFLNKRFLEEEKTKPQNERSTMSLIEKLEFVIHNQFKRVSYTEAIDILKNSNHNKKKKFQYPVNEWGVDLQSEHERYLVEKHFECPVILYDYPANIKAFYMRLNEDGKTVRAMDILFPGIGEIVGGSQREERYDVLKQKIADLHMDEATLWWYLDLRKFGTAVHSGFGLGFERLVLFATGMTNIRDVIPYPRTPQSAEF